MSTYSQNNNNGGGSVSIVSNATRYIVNILVQYQKLNDTRLEQKEKQVILNDLLKNIDVVELIDHFNIVLDESVSSEEAFEAMYHMILMQMNNISHDSLQSLSSSARLKVLTESVCTVSICKMLQRNNRERIAGYAMSQVYYGVKEETHMIILQLLDKMHCYLMHSFDVCLKWSKRDMNYIYNGTHTHMMEADPMLQRIKEKIDQKKQNIAKTSARFDDNRYATRIQKEHTFQHDSSPYPFTFGKRWRYSKKYATSEGVDPKNGGKYNEWFVSQKYTNLKREMLSNALKKIPMLQWNHINTKAEEFMKCNKMRSLRAAKAINYGFDFGNIEQAESIGVEHIICILIYCNFSAIKHSLTDTYKPMNKYEQWKDVRSKHSEYANFARILTETIECFGDNIDGNKLFYHCVLGAFELHSLDARFFVPTSMTQQLSVITYYCSQYSDGLILGLTAIHSDLKYLNCSFLSDFTNELEVIFLGGKNTLRFCAIYDLSKMHNYQYYLSAIEMIEECFIKSQCGGQITMNQLLFAAVKKCICNQTQETPCVPPRIDYYLNSWCVSIKNITVHLTHLTHNVYLKQLLLESQLLTQYDDNVCCCNMDSLCRLFPNATTIHLIEAIVDLTQLHQFLDSQMFYSLGLTQIHLISPTLIGDPEANLSNEVIQRFFNSGWSIQQSNKTTVVIKKLKPQQPQGHVKSQSTPNALVNDDPFGSAMQQMNKSHGHILSEDLLFENDSIHSVAPVLIKLRMKSHLKDHKDMNIEFVFNPDESPQQVANDMIHELGLPSEYLDAVVHTIHQCIYKQTTSSNNSNIIVSFSYTHTAPSNNDDDQLNAIQQNTNDFGPTMDQKRALQQQQKMIKQKHVPVTHLGQQFSAPQMVTANNNNNNETYAKSASSPDVFPTSIFDTPLVLNAFNKYAFPLSSVQLLEGKKEELDTEYVAFLKTQSQIFELKLEHIGIQQNEKQKTYHNEEQELIKSMQDKIDAKRKELTGKWDEFVQDQTELNELKQQISAKHLVQFKQQLHFENQTEYQQIIASDKISKSEKEQFRAQLKDFRDQMIEDYKAFRENHYGKYDQKLKQTQALKQQSAMQYATPQ
eukprot:254539_1